MNDKVFMPFGSICNALQGKITESENPEELIDLAWRKAKQFIAEQQNPERPINNTAPKTMNPQSVSVNNINEILAGIGKPSPSVVTQGKTIAKVGNVGKQVKKELPTIQVE